MAPLQLLIRVLFYPQTLIPITKPPLLEVRFLIISMLLPILMEKFKGVWSRWGFPNEKQSV